MTSAPNKFEISYTPSKTAAQFMRESCLVRGLMGPVGSGKSSACCWELFRRSCAQKPGRDGIRRTRWLVIRNTYAELKHTTLKTFQDWFPPHLFGGQFTATPPMVQTLKFDDMEAEFIFLALDHEADVRKLKSFECTGAWVNEASEVSWQAVRTLIERCGRYPSKREGGATWRGIVMDTNPPHDQHWWFKKFEEERPQGWRIYKQPSGLAEDAENTENLPADYYQQIVAASAGDTDLVEVMVHGRYGVLRQGHPVFGHLWDDRHNVQQPAAVDIYKPVVIGLDFGLTPAAVFLQQKANGQWQLLHELVPQGVMGAEQFAPVLKAAMLQHFAKEQRFVLWGDPAGNQRNQADARTAFDVFKGFGLKVRPSPTQNLSDRLATVRTVLAREIDGQKGLVVHPDCLKIRQALRGGYHYSVVHENGSPRPTGQPAKDEHSHITDALQYALCGGGEWQRLKAGQRQMAPVQLRDPLAWQL